MSQRSIMLMMLVAIIAMFGGMVAYDMTKNHRLERTNVKKNWQWKDNWTPEQEQLPEDAVEDEEMAEEEEIEPKAQREQVEAKTYQEALKKSTELNLPVLVMFKAGWCHWCVKMEKDTLTNARVKTVMTNYVLVFVDTDKHPALAKKFGIAGLPAYVVTNSQESKLKEGSGYKDAKQFEEWLNDPKLFEEPKEPKEPKSPKKHEPKSKPERKKKNKV